MTKGNFEDIKRIDENKQEYWSSRELSDILEYKEYRNFLSVIQKAKEACKNSNQDMYNHFVDATDMVKIGSGAERELKTIYLSRYACYLIIQNSDPTKEVVALGQTYFAVQTRKQEISESLIEDSKRVVLRGEMIQHNKKLSETAKSAGVIEPIDYAIFQNFGYKGLYDGLDQKDIHSKKGLKKSQKILDHMGSEELAANLFRATQAEAKLRRDRVANKFDANMAHKHVGEKVRATIKELGGTMPEDLPVADGVGKVKTRLKKVQKKRLKG